MRSKHILHVVGTINPAAGGVSEAIRLLIKYGPEGYDHEVVSVDRPDAAFLRDLPFVVHALGPHGFREFSRRLLPWMMRNRHRFDGVFVHGVWIYTGFAAMLAFSGRTPYVVFTHGMLDPYFKYAFPFKHMKKWLYWVAAEFWVLRGAYKVLFTGEAEERLAKESFWLHHWKPMVVGFGATGPEGDADAQRHAFLEICPEVRGHRFLIFLGRIHRKKGCELLIEAFARTAALDPGLHLVMAGPDQQNWQAELMRMANSADVTARIHWPGMLKGDAKWGSFFAAEAFVLPSHQENFGIAVAEAMACGRPVLLSDQVNIAPDIAAASAGLMEPDTVAGTERLLRRWMAMSAAERYAMGMQARTTFLQRYDMRANAKAIVRVFEGSALQARQVEHESYTSAMQ